MLNKDELIKYWLASAQHDLTVAQDLFDKDHYDWCLFIGHLVIEKILKAFFIRDNIENEPPKIHNLLKLAEKSNLKLTDEVKLFLLDVTNFHIETRYPDYKFKFYKLCTREFTDKNFQQIKELYQWLRNQII
ncbi:HEPN domain-containing protein [candidate division KSB1 bacterium]|nr:HEPN domain-containing protein [candidate division KSB1 bacterium]